MHIVNITMQTGIFPKIFKCTSVTLILENGGPIMATFEAGEGGEVEEEKLPRTKDNVIEIWKSSRT